MKISLVERFCVNILPPNLQEISLHRKFISGLIQFHDHEAHNNRELEKIWRLCKLSPMVKFLVWKKVPHSWIAKSILNLPGCLRKIAFLHSFSALNFLIFDRLILIVQNDGFVERMFLIWLCCQFFSLHGILGNNWISLWKYWKKNVIYILSKFLLPYLNSGKTVK